MKRLHHPGSFLVTLILWLTLTNAFPNQGLAQQKAGGNADLFGQAENLYRAHRFDDALRSYEQFLQTKPPAQQWHYAFLRTAELYGIRGDWHQALTRYERLLTMQTDSGIALKARYGAGQANYKLGNQQEAERILGNLSAASLPAELRFKTNALLTELSLQAGNTTQAFSRLLLVEKDLPSGEEDWFQDLKTRLLTRANPLDLEKLADMYRDTPLTAAVLLQLAKVEIQAGHPEKAETWLTTLQQRFPDSPETAQAAQLKPAGEKAKPPALPRVVGCLIPLTGENADFGRQVKNGLELAASQSGTAIIIKDSGSTAEATTAALAELADNPQVLALIGFFPIATADAAADAAQELEVPLLALTQKKDITLSRDFVFRDFLTQHLMLQGLLNYTANTMGWQRYGMLYPNSRYGQSLSRIFNEELDRQAGKLVAQASYADGGTDLAQAVQTLVQANAGQDSPATLDAVFVPDDPKVVAAIAKEIAATPLAHVHLLGTNILQSAGTLQYGEVLAGILFPDGFFAADADPAVKAFVADYRQRYRQAPTYLAAQGYSSMRLLAEAQKKFTGLSRKEFADALYHQDQPAGFSLFKGFNADREAETAAKIITIKDKEFQLEN
jgi:branched-chain amino acid transport system substrate-binding protein